ncbi:MAG: hypothetical protein J6J52_04480 [Oscillospiraceae bacterium]|nr:hypothetical protein [Oscillospiraceae bacterium]
MKKYMLSIIKYYENELMKETSDKEKLSSELLTRIQFMQHERFIHLIVTVLFSLILFICILGFVCFEKIAFLPIIVLVLCLLIPYIAHYFFLENKTQYLYSLYEKYTKGDKDE